MKPSAQPKAAAKTPSLALDSSSTSSLSFNFQTVKAEVTGDPASGIEAPPPDVQTLADQHREEVVGKIVQVKARKTQKSEKGDNRVSTSCPTFRSSRL